MTFQQPPEPQGIRPGVLGVILLATAVASIVVISFYLHKAPPKENAPAMPDRSLAQPLERPQAVLETSRPEMSATPGLPDSAMAKLIADLFDSSLPLQARCKAAMSLAQMGTDTAMAALKKALAENSPPYLKAAIATAFGVCPNPEARRLLNELVHDKEEITARGAVRGLAMRGDADALTSLGNLLFNDQTPLSVRTEAALSLGDVNLPGAQALLMRAMTEIKDEAIVENVLTGLGKRPFAETQFFFNNYLASPDVSVESKVAAIEALGNATGDVTPFLLNYLSNPDAEVRAAAVWSLITAAGTNDISPQLISVFQQEQDPTVRSRLYQALENQTTTNALSMLPLVQGETNPSARLAGLDFLAGTLKSSPAPEVLTFFNQTAVPELQNTALNSDNSQSRLAAVLALDRARTPAAITALKTIQQQSTDKKVVSAVRLP